MPLLVEHDHAEFATEQAVGLIQRPRIRAELRGRLDGVGEGPEGGR